MKLTGAWERALKVLGLEFSLATVFLELPLSCEDARWLLPWKSRPCRLSWIAATSPKSCTSIEYLNWIDGEFGRNDNNSPRMSTESCLFYCDRRSKELLEFYSMFCYFYLNRFNLKNKSKLTSGGFKSDERSRFVLLTRYWGIVSVVKKCVSDRHSKVARPFLFWPRRRARPHRSGIQRFVASRTSEARGCHGNVKDIYSFYGRWLCRWRKEKSETVEIFFNLLFPHFQNRNKKRKAKVGIGRLPVCRKPLPIAKRIFFFYMSTYCFFSP